MLFECEALPGADGLIILFCIVLEEVYYGHILDWFRLTIPENVRGLAERMPNARLIVVPDGGHFFFGHNEEVKEEITQFLRSSVAELHSETLIQAGGLSNVHAN